MKDTWQIGGVVTLIAFVLSPGVALAFDPVAPELDPSLSIAGLALLGGTAAFVIERYRRRTK
jgi:hypothetical protein